MLAEGGAVFFADPPDAMVESEVTRDGRTTRDRRYYLPSAHLEALIRQRLPRS